ncbi:DUF481 domain-containing protein [Ulvibacterium sp.]|uniref:DUF481 domain-containing protein n=1 Tax=Ulvibacterium sp. TaxID=2665914 RepID=UPI002603E7ED|nr:DUF481 domain-containing protein [Ulvibacterium sp.]
MSGFWQGGNVETLIFRTKSDVSFRTGKKWVFKTTNSYVYQESDRVKSDEDLLSMNFIYFNPERRIYPFALGIINTDFARDINLRYNFGIGGTYQILRKKEHWLKLAINAGYEQTDFASSDFNRPEFNGTSSISTLRATFWVNGKYELLKKKLVFGHESYFQPSLEQSNNFRWQADLSLEMPVWEFLNVKINYLHIHESVVVEEQKKEDRLLTIGFTLNTQ